MAPRAQIPPPHVQTMSDSPTEPACSSTPLGEMNIPEPMMFPEEMSKGLVILRLPVDTELPLYTFLCNARIFFLLFLVK